jgi:hypothetical protein
MKPLKTCLTAIALSALLGTAASAADTAQAPKQAAAPMIASPIGAPAVPPPAQPAVDVAAKPAQAIPAPQPSSASVRSTDEDIPIKGVSITCEYRDSGSEHTEAVDGITVIFTVTGEAKAHGSTLAEAVAALKSAGYGSDKRPCVAVKTYGPGNAEWSFLGIRHPSAQISGGSSMPVVGY